MITESMGNCWDHRGEGRKHLLWLRVTETWKECMHHKHVGRVQLLIREIWKECAMDHGIWWWWW